ncbi:MAG: hypothetical protein VZQ98_13390 [Bacteroidales bacterium]|nr:hypothetical protein [Bacteroidales bacterium]
MGCAATEARRGDTNPTVSPLRGYGSSSIIHHAGVNTPAYGVSFLRNLGWCGIHTWLGNESMNHAPIIGDKQLIITNCWNSKLFANLFSKNI